MKKFFLLILMAFGVMIFAQKSSATAKKSPAKPVAKTKAKASAKKPGPDLAKINDSIPALIPFKVDGKFGFKNQKNAVIIPKQFSNAGFFYEDCNLLNSPNEKIRKFGSNHYASVRDATGDYRIDMSGKKVYKFKDADLGKCPTEFKKQLYHSYVKSGFYGIVEDAKFVDESDYRQYQIYPQYEYLHIMEGDDLNNPMIIASFKDRFGVIDKNNKVVIPFEYADIKRNFSWKIARLFEVTKDGKNYFFVDVKNKEY